ncbi:MAG: DegQ family serine endoprotease [Gammaproteobacteria bacterium]
MPDHPDPQDCQDCSQGPRGGAQRAAGRGRRGGKALIATAAAAAVIAALHAGTSSTPAIAAAPVNQDGAVSVTPVNPGSFAPIVKAVQPAVVHVSTRGSIRPTAFSGGIPLDRLPPQLREYFERFGNGPDSRGHPSPAQGVGSGFITDAEGYIVTNNHVVSDAETIVVTLQDGTEHTARLIGRDPKTDLALLKIDADGPLPYVMLGDSDSAEVGDWVVAVGSPFGLGGTVTAGIISARGRNINSGPYDDYLQIDAPINRGNSGGPLFDARGKVIGVNTAIFSPSGGSVGIGFAIPSAQVGPIIDDLKSAGRVSRGWLGIQIQPVTEDIAQSLGLSDARGALIAGVLPDSPAARAGLRTGDVVVEFASRPVADARGLSRLAAATESGAEVDVTVWRNGQRETLALAVGEMPAEQVAALSEPTPPNEADTPKLGLALAPLTTTAREQLGLAAARGGVLVADVAEDGPAFRKGIRSGDVIVMVGQRAVSAPQDVIDAVAATAERKSVLLLVMRDGQERFIAVPLDRA